MVKQHVYWLTGLSGAGKTTVATTVLNELNKYQDRYVLLDGDMLRDGLCKDLGFNTTDRYENIRRVAEVSKLFLQNGKSCICTFISPTDAIRELAKGIIGAPYFHEIYINTPLKICENRDPKGLYRKVRAGEIKNFTGIGSVYEIPSHPNLILDCYNNSLQESVTQLLTYIRGTAN